jgi:hypothetical protein
MSSGPAAPTRTASSADGSGRYEAELIFCIAETNRLRASVGRSPLARSAELEAYAASAARVDGLARTPHQYSQATNHGNGLSLAENELLYWNLSHYKTVRNIVAQGRSRRCGRRAPAACTSRT